MLPLPWTVGLPRQSRSVQGVHLHTTTMSRPLRCRAQKLRANEPGGSGSYSKFLLEVTKRSKYTPLPARCVNTSTNRKIAPVHKRSKIRPYLPVPWLRRLPELTEGQDQDQPQHQVIYEKLPCFA